MCVVAEASKTEVEVLDLVRTYLSADDGREFEVPEWREPNEAFALAFRDAGYTFESKVGSLALVELARDTATVRASRTHLTKRGRRSQEREQELAVHLVWREGWKVRDVSTEDGSVAGRLHVPLVEPPEAEGISVRGWARTDPSGQVFLAVTVHNASRRRWRMKGGGVTKRKGRLWLLDETSWRTLRRGWAVDYRPGSEHGILFTVPANTDRLWLRAKPRFGLRSFFFALSWEPPSATAQAEPATLWKRVVLMALAGLPIASIAAFIAVVKTVQLAIVFALFFPAVMFLEQHWCVWHLERKLARFRAASLSGPRSKRTKWVCSVWGGEVVGRHDLGPIGKDVRGRREQTFAYQFPRRPR